MAKINVSWGRGARYNGELRNLQVVDAQRMADVGRWLIGKLITRTQSGRDETGVRFRPYTPRYAERKGVAATDVDLTLSGDMLGALEQRAWRNRVRIRFSSEAMARRARYNEGMGRRFLGIDESWLTEVHRRLRDGIRFFRN